MGKKVVNVQKHERKLSSGKKIKVKKHQRALESPDQAIEQFRKKHNIDFPFADPDQTVFDENSLFGDESLSYQNIMDDIFDNIARDEIDYSEESINMYLDNYDLSKNEQKYLVNKAMTGNEGDISRLEKKYGLSSNEVNSALRLMGIDPHGKGTKEQFILYEERLTGMNKGDIAYLNRQLGTNIKAIVFDQDMKDELAGLEDMIKEGRLNRNPVSIRDVLDREGEFLPNEKEVIINKLMDRPGYKSISAYPSREIVNVGDKTTSYRKVIDGKNYFWNSRHGSIEDANKFLKRREDLTGYTGKVIEFNGEILTYSRDEREIK